MNLDSYYRDFHIYVFFYGFSFVLAGLMKVFHTPVNTTGLVTGMEFYVYASLLLTAIIFLHPFRILGEAIRYMEYGVYFTNFLVVYSCLKYGHISILIFYFLIMISASLHAIYRLIEKSAAILTVTNTSVEELQEVLKAHPEKVILPIPFKMAFMLLPGCENRFVSSFLPMGKIEEISKTYSFPISNFRKIHKAYHFDWILTVKGMGARYDFTGLPRVFENKRYVIYRYD